LATSTWAADRDQRRRLLLDLLGDLRQVEVDAGDLPLQGQFLVEKRLHLGSGGIDLPADPVELLRLALDLAIDGVRDRGGEQQGQHGHGHQRSDDPAEPCTWTPPQLLHRPPRIRRIVPSRMRIWTISGFS